MDWTTIGYVALIAVGFTVNLVPLQRWIHQELSFGASLLVGVLGAAVAVYVEVLLVFVALIVGEHIVNWGIGNFVVASLVASSIVVAPYVGKSLLMKTFVGVPHYVKKFFAEFKTYKAELEEKAPIKRSVYELMEK